MNDIDYQDARAYKVVCFLPTGGSIIALQLNYQNLVLRGKLNLSMGLVPVGCMQLIITTRVTLTPSFLTSITGS